MIEGGSMMELLKNAEVVAMQLRPEEITILKQERDNFKNEIAALSEKIKEHPNAYDIGVRSRLVWELALTEKMLNYIF